MSNYRLFGAESSPYSLKVRAFLRYKGIDFDWVTRSSANDEEFSALAKTPSVPLLVSPDNPPNQDSTDILAKIESQHAEPSAVPANKLLAALALILEDYADEWLNKAMFAIRWGGLKADREAAAQRTMEQLFDGKLPRTKKKTRDQIAARMVERLPLVGIEGSNAKVLTASFHRFATLLNAHLENNLFIFGGRPSVADFALAGQLQQMLMDPTPAKWLRDQAPFVTAWCEFMEAPKAGADFKSLEELQDTLLPLFREEVALTYLPWADANQAARQSSSERFSVEMEGTNFEQGVQHYAAKSYRSLSKAMNAMSDVEGLVDFMKTSGMDFRPSKG